MGDLHSMELETMDQDTLLEIDFETVSKILLAVSHDKNYTQEVSLDQCVQVLVRLLNCETELVQIRTAIKLGRIAKLAPENILEKTVPHVVALLSRPSHSHSPSIQETAAFCLGRFACRADNLSSTVGDYGALPILLRLLQESEGRMQRVVAKSLRELVICTQSNQVILARSGGVETIIHIMASSSDDIKKLAAEILSAMTSLKEVRRAIVSFNGLSMLVKSARLGRIASRTRAAQAIGLLGVTRRIRRMLVNAGAIPALTDLLREGDLPAKLVSGNALGIISAHVDYLRPVAQAGAIPLFAELLEGSDPQGKEIAEDVFSILAVAEENAIAIAEHLVRILQGSNAEAKAAAADVIWDLSSYKHSISVVSTSGAIPLLLRLLEDENDEVKEKASGAVAQLSYDQGDRGALAEAGAIPILMSLLRDESEELKDNVAEALINFSEDPLLKEHISEAFNIPAFQDIQERLARIRQSDEHTVRSLRVMSLEQFTS
uniref:Armadillo repeat-containing domain-containing protein n=1 Tax=Araucaria cunninghamii TaxID=56994 RepID=A0A0D6R931_ARACU